MLESGTFLAGVIILLIRPSTEVSLYEERCRHAIESSCWMHYEGAEIWCDQTNRTTIPRPSSFHFLAPAKVAFALFFNKTCLREVNGDILQKYLKLETLNLCHNFIERLKRNSFKNSGTLLHLMITDNRLRKIERDALAGLGNLEHLDLSNNLLNRLPNKVFHDLVSLRILKIRNNELENLPELVFVKLGQLVELDLSGNKLQMISHSHLKGLVKLGLLNLQGNLLQGINRALFSAASQIQKLFINDNSITCLEEDIFLGQNLTALKMAGNPLRTPHASWFRDEGSSKVRKLEYDQEILGVNGSWLCDCKAYSYRKFLENLGAENEWLSVFNIECSAPPQLRGRKLNSLTWDEISSHSHCEDPEENSKCSDGIATPTVVRKTTKPTTTTSTTSAPPTTTTTTSTQTTSTTSEEKHPAVIRSPRSEQSSSSVEVKLEYIIPAACVAVFFIFVLVFCKFKTCSKLKDKEADSKEKSTDEERSDIAQRTESRSRSLTSRLDSVSTNENRRFTRDSAIFMQDYDRECGSGRSQNTQGNSRYSVASLSSHFETKPKMVQPPTSPPLRNTQPNSLMNDHFNTPSTHTYESLNSHVPMMSQDGNSMPYTEEWVHNQSGRVPSQPGPMHIVPSYPVVVSAIPQQTYGPQPTYYPVQHAPYSTLTMVASPNPAHVIGDYYTPQIPNYPPR